MKVSQLRQIIKEEISKVLNEAIKLERTGEEIDIESVELDGPRGDRYIVRAKTLPRELTHDELNELQDQEGVMTALDTAMRD